jgi:hypothetical protein
VGFLAWLVPGLGQLFMGRPLKALLFFLAVAPAFATGLWMTGFTAVNPSKYTLEFIAHVFGGGLSALSLYLFSDATLDAMPRWFEVGRLYVSVASLLNVVAISDAMGEAIFHNRRVDELRRRARAAEARPVPAEAPAPQDADAAWEGNGDAAAVPHPSPALPPLEWPSPAEPPPSARSGA